MTRATPTAVPACLLVLAVLVAGCLPATVGQRGTAAPSGAPAATAGTGARTPDASTPPSGADSPTPATATPAPVRATPVPATVAPVTPDPGAATPDPSPSPASSTEPSAAPSTGTDPGAAAACTGTDQNREFYAHVAGAVDWPVYCAVLPSGWHVDSGTYRLANGGRLEIAYAGPGGARLTLSEGAFCPDASGCVPAGSDAGTTAFGDRDGTLVALDDGSWAVVVDRGASLSWLLVGAGLDEAATRSLAGALAAVGG